MIFGPFDGTSWTHFDHDLGMPGIQDAPWSPRGVNAVVFQNKIWVIGSNLSGLTNDVWSFDGAAWTHFDHDSVAAGIQDAPWAPKI